MRSFHDACVFLAMVAAFVPAAARAATIEQDRIVVQATDPSAVRVEHTLVWKAGADAGPAKELELYLARGVTLIAARSGETDLAFSSSRVDGSTLERWTVRLDRPLAPGESRELVLVTSIGASESPGIRVDADGGLLLPGSGWFPSTRLEADETAVHRTAFRLAAGQTGVAAGAGSAGLWATERAVRPFAAWGAWQRSEFRSGDVSCVAYRRAGAAGDVPGLAELPELVYALDTGLGPIEGDGPWTFVDVGRDVLAGGFRTVFWDEKAAGRGGPLWNRDLAAALAVSYWTESLRFTGSLAALFSRSFPLYLGDAAAVTLDMSDTRWKTEAALVGPRRDEFAANRKADRVLRNLLASSPDAPFVLRTRGALVVHKTESVFRSTAHFMDFLRQFRTAHAGTDVDDAVFGTELDARVGNRSRYLSQYLDKTDLPDFVLGEHGTAESKMGPARYRVEFENRGKVADAVHISSFDAYGVELRYVEKPLGPGEKGAVQLADVDRIARVELDARRISLQSDYSGEVIEREVAPAAEPHRPAFEFERADHDFRWVTGFRFDLDGVSIRDFEGHVMWYRTHHGPSGLLMFGNAKVVVSPPAPQAESFRKALGRDRMEFTTPELFVRFPPSRWKDIKEQLESAEVRGHGPDEGAIRFLYDYSFPAYFSEGNRAQVPPPGGALVIFSLGGVERRGFVRDPKADGTVYSRFWDQLRGSTLWEDTR